LRDFRGADFWCAMFAIFLPLPRPGEVNTGDIQTKTPESNGRTPMSSKAINVLGTPAIEVSLGLTSEGDGTLAGTLAVTPCSKAARQSFAIH